MVNEYSYCPRLAYLEWVQGEWAGSADTVEGSHAHRRVDRGGGSLPAADAEDFERLHATSVTLSSERLGLIARIDLIEAEDGQVVPVDYKQVTEAAQPLSRVAVRLVSKRAHREALHQAARDTIRRGGALPQPREHHGRGLAEAGGCDESIRPITLGECLLVGERGGSAERAGKELGEGHRAS